MNTTSERRSPTGKLIVSRGTAYCYKCGKTAQRIIVRSRPGGLVSQNCESCGHPNKVGLRQLPPLDCPHCGNALEPFTNHRKNYAYGCSLCDTATELASMVPHWDELFEYDGLGLDSDQQRAREVDRWRAFLEEVRAKQHTK